MLVVSNAAKVPAQGEVWECHTTSGVCVFLRPGVTDSYKTGWSHTLDTLWGTQYNETHPGTFPGTPSTNGQTRQVFDEYLDYAILASTIGDLQFDSLGGPINPVIPPEFGRSASTRRVAWADAQGIYHVRFSNLRAPSIAGLYVFKIPGISEGNYPILIVKDELNPAWIEATVRTQNVMGTGALISGLVTATGTTPEGRSVTGTAHWGLMDFVGTSTKPGEVGNLYRTYLFGLAAGTYEIKAEALGFSPAVSKPFPVDLGQSYHLDLVVLKPPPVLSKSGTISGTAASTITLSALLAPPSCASPLSGIRGTVYWYDQYGVLRLFPWAQVTATSTDGSLVASSTTDGTYILCVPPGTYNVTASSDPGFISQTKKVVFSASVGEVGVDFQLSPSGKPIPEYPAPIVPALLLTATLAVVIMIRRRVH